MTSRALIAVTTLIAFTNAAPAQEVSGRLDLEAIAPQARVRLVTARVMFAKNDVACPRISGWSGFRRKGSTTIGHFCQGGR